MATRCHKKCKAAAFADAWLICFWDSVTTTVRRFSSRAETSAASAFTQDPRFAEPGHDGILRQEGPPRQGFLEHPLRKATGRAAQILVFRFPNMSMSSHRLHHFASLASRHACVQKRQYVSEGSRMLLDRLTEHLQDQKMHVTSLYLIRTQLSMVL